MLSRTAVAVIKTKTKDPLQQCHTVLHSLAYLPMHRPAKVPSATFALTNSSFTLALSTALSTPPSPPTSVFVSSTWMPREQKRSPIRLWFSSLGCWEGLICSHGMLSPLRVGLGPFSRFIEECDGAVAWFWGLLVDMLRLGLWLHEA